MTQMVSTRLQEVERRGVGSLPVAPFSSTPIHGNIA
jgi:hypothetical protein